MNNEKTGDSHQKEIAERTQKRWKNCQLSTEIQPNVRSNRTGQ